MFRKYSTWNFYSFHCIQSAYSMNKVNSHSLLYAKQKAEYILTKYWITMTVLLFNQLTQK